MNTYLQKLVAGIRRAAGATAHAFRLTPARVHNASVLVGVALTSVGAADAFGRSVGLMTAGALVLGFTVLERVLPFLRSRG